PSAPVILTASITIGLRSSGGGSGDVSRAAGMVVCVRCSVSRMYTPVQVSSAPPPFTPYRMYTTPIAGGVHRPNHEAEMNGHSAERLPEFATNVGNVISRLLAPSYALSVYATPLCSVKF